MLTTPLTSALSEYTVTDAVGAGGGCPIPDRSSSWNLSILDNMFSNTVAASYTSSAEVFPSVLSSSLYLLHFNSSISFRQQDAEVSRAGRLSSRSAGIPLRRVK